MPTLFMRHLLAITVVNCAFLFAGPTKCVPISSGETLNVHMGLGRVACFLVTVGLEEQTQLRAEQPVDLALRVSGGNAESIVDGFEFGKETLTFLTAGRYRVEVRPLVPPGRVLNLSMSRHAISLQNAKVWRRAEISATDSKRTGKPEDIVDSLVLWKEVGDGVSVARTYLKRGDAYLNSHEPPEARVAYEEALSICEPLADIRCVAEAANNSGYAEFLLGDLEAASHRLQEGAQYFRRISLHQYEGSALSNLGLMFWQAGDFEQAIKALDTARQILRERAAATSHAQVLNNLGLCYQSLGENAKASAYFQSARAVFLNQHEPRHAFRASLNLGHTYMSLGRLELARGVLEQALDEAKRLSDLSGQADILNNLGQVWLRRARAEEARKYLTQALALHRTAHARRGEAFDLHYLGIEARDRGDIESARKLLAEAAQVRREAGLRDDASESVFALAELEYHAGNPRSAHELTNQAVSLIESLRNNIPNPSLRATYYARKRRVFDLLTDIAMASPQDAAAGLLASEQARGRALLDLITGGVISGAVPRDLLERRTSLRAQIGLLSLRLTNPDPPTVNDVERRRLERERAELRSRIELNLGEVDQVESEIRKALNASGLGRPLASISELQNGLPADSALLEYYLGPSESYLWVVQRRDIQCFRLPSRAEIETLAWRTVERFGAIVERRRSPQAQAAFSADLRRLSRILLGPLATVQLPPRLILVLDGVLNRVPMAVLRPPWAREELGLSHDLVQAPSGAYLLAAKPPKPPSAFPRSILAIADPVFSSDDPRVMDAPKQPVRRQGLPRIPFLDDIAALESLLPPDRIRVLRGFDAAPSILRQASPHDFGVLHFSTHALIDDRTPELSRVVLSLVDRFGRPTDGYLHPYDFAGFRLDHPVVVLSSCDTALGKEVLGEGLAGFSNGLFSAGASQLVLTLTKVDAESSAAFFAEAYRRFFNARPGSMEHSITLARRALAHSDRWHDPFFWAPYIVIGAPNITGAR